MAAQYVAYTLGEGFDFVDDSLGFVLGEDLVCCVAFFCTANDGFDVLSFAVVEIARAFWMLLVGEGDGIRGLAVRGAAVAVLVAPGVGAEATVAHIHSKLATQPLGWMGQDNVINAIPLLLHS